MHAYGALCVGASLTDVLQQVDTQSFPRQKIQPGATWLADGRCKVAPVQSPPCCTCARRSGHSVLHPPLTVS